MPKLSIIVTIFKNQYNIAPFYDDFCSNIRPYIDDYEIIMVDDASPDDSWSEMVKLAKKDPKVRLIKFSRNFGDAAGVYTALKYATGDCATVKSCDLQEPAELTLEMYKKWQEGAKIVVGARESRNDPPATKFFASLYYKLMQKFVIDNMPDGGFDIHLIDRQVIDDIVEMNDKNSLIRLQLLWLDYDYEKVYYVRKKREIGKSSWTFMKKAKLFVDSFVGFSYIPIRIMSLIGALFAIIAVAYSIWMIICKIMGTIPIQGYTGIFVLVLFSAGMIMFSLGILGEYMWRTLDAARNRPIAVVSRTVNFDK